MTRVLPCVFSHTLLDLALILTWFLDSVTLCGIMPTCCAPGCNRNERTIPHVTFFCLPWDNKQRITQWLRQLSLKHCPKPGAKICHLHFEDKYLTLDLKYTVAPHLWPNKNYRLTQDAIPTIFAHKKSFTTGRPTSLARQHEPFTKRPISPSILVRYS